MNEKAREKIAQIISDELPEDPGGDELLQVANKILSLPELNALNELSGVLVKKECKDSGPEHCMTKCKVCKGTGFITRELTNGELIEWTKKLVRAIGSLTQAGERLELKK